MLSRLKNFNQAKCLVVYGKTFSKIVFTFLGGKHMSSYCLKSLVAKQDSENSDD